MNIKSNYLSLFFIFLLNNIFFQYKDNVVYGQDVPLLRFQVTTSSDHITVHDCMYKFEINSK